MLSRAEIQAPVPIWPAGAPGALGGTTNDIPTLTAYLPDAATATGAALVICPGGGYAHYSTHEGVDYALWLNQHGVACFVLRYRLGLNGYHHPAMFQDATRAVRLVRAKAAEWKIDPKRVGIMGSSAGGHLAATVMTHYDAGNPKADDPVERQSSRPDLGILCYAVITMGEFTNQGSKQNFFGANQPSPELIKEFSEELQVTTNTPPCFIWTTFEDTIVPMENSLMFAAALRKNHVPFDLHVFQKGGHGLVLGDGEPPFSHTHPWASDCLFWLKAQGCVKD